jgi:S-formylglutathione hydrolase FrmB
LKISYDPFMSDRGKIVVHRHRSKVLEGNPLGDPTERDLYVYLPPGHDPSNSYPCLLAVVGFTGTGGMLFNLDPLGEDLKRRLDRLITTGKCPPVIVAAPDCFTGLGGNQYINSTATGRYEEYLLDEIVPYISSAYGTGHWGVFGKSSGGYGSIVLGMRHSDVFKAVADHSGDSNFELCYIPDACEALDQFREAGGPRAWLDKFWSDDNRHRKKWQKALNFLAMAAHYSPNPDSPNVGIDLPFDLETGEFRWDVWQRWMEWDPVRMVERYADNLRKLRLIYVDCGTKDEFALHWGARALVTRMRHFGLSPFYEEFDDGHMSISYRYDVSLPLLVRALAR